MAYPLNQMPTFRELRERLEKTYGCQFIHGLATVHQQDGTSFSVACFVRSVEGKKRRCAISFEDWDDRINVEVLRSICQRLKIDPADFDLHLD